MSLKRICVFCGSRFGNRPEYRQTAEALGRALAEKGIELIYGGGKIGLMGAVADACLEAGGSVVGVIPRFMLDWEVGHQDITRLEIVDSMHSRKARMAELAEGFIALPGGLGTFEELFEILTWAQLGFHGKPVGLMDVLGYYEPLRLLVAAGLKEGFMKPEHRGLLLHDDNVYSLLRAMSQYHPLTVAHQVKEGKQL